MAGKHQRCQQHYSSKEGRDDGAMAHCLALLMLSVYIGNRKLVRRQPGIDFQLFTTLMKMAAIHIRAVSYTRLGQRMWAIRQAEGQGVDARCEDVTSHTCEVGQYGWCPYAPQSLPGVLDPNDAITWYSQPVFHLRACCKEKQPTAEHHRAGTAVLSALLRCSIVTVIVNRSTAKPMPCCGFGTRPHNNRLARTYIVDA